MATAGQLKQLPAEDVVESRVKVYLIFVDVFKQFVCAEHLGNAHQLTHTHTHKSVGVQLHTSAVNVALLACAAGAGSCRS